LLLALVGWSADLLLIFRRLIGFAVAAKKAPKKFELLFLVFVQISNLAAK
jgi:hypothetical protein